MTGLKIDFEQGRAVLDLNSTVTKEMAQVQNILVNMATESPVPYFPGRGTGLLQAFASTGFISQVYAQHQANFAAIDSLFFCSTFNTENRDLRTITLEAPPTGFGELIFALEVQFNNGTIQTTTLPV